MIDHWTGRIASLERSDALGVKLDSLQTDQLAEHSLVIGFLIGVVLWLAVMRFIDMRGSK